MVRVNVLIVIVLVTVVVAAISCVEFVQQGDIEAVVYGEKQASPSSWQSCDAEAMFEIACALTAAAVNTTICERKRSQHRVSVLETRSMLKHRHSMKSGSWWPRYQRSTSYGTLRLKTASSSQRSDCPYPTDS